MSDNCQACLRGIGKSLGIEVGQHTCESMVDDIGIENELRAQLTKANEQLEQANELLNECVTALNRMTTKHFDYEARSTQAQVMSYLERKDDG